MSQQVAVDIVTIPDIDAGQRIYQFGNIDADNAAKAMFHLHTQARGNIDLPHTMQQIVYIHCHELSVDGKQYSWGLGQSTEDSEEAIIKRFLQFLQNGEYQPVFWGAGDKLALLNTRYLKYPSMLTDSSSHWPVDGLDAQAMNALSLYAAQHGICDDDLLELGLMADLTEARALSLRSRWARWQGSQYKELISYSSLKAQLIAYVHLLQSGCNNSFNIEQLSASLNELKINQVVV